MGTFGRKAQIKCCSLLYICNKNNELKLFSEVLQFISFYFSPKEIFQFSLFCLSIFFLFWDTLCWTCLSYHVIWCHTIESLHCWVTLPLEYVKPVAFVSYFSVMTSRANEHVCVGHIRMCIWYLPPHIQTHMWKPERISY